MTRDNWIWMPHAGHLCVGHECRFHLNTYVGGFIVSTVGEWWPDSQVREIHADVRGTKLQGMGDDRARDFLRKVGFIEIGSGRTYETMVFRAKAGEGCCPWVQDGECLEMQGYNQAEAAYLGHLAFCEQWAAKTEAAP